jgi:hypothetical protein
MIPLIIKSFEASTSHITEEDNEKLMGETRDELVVYPYGRALDALSYGMLVYVNPNGQFGLGAPSRDFNELHGLYSDAFIRLLQIAVDEDCKFLQLDRDGMIYPELPQFDW